MDSGFMCDPVEGGGLVASMFAGNEQAGRIE